MKLLVALLAIVLLTTGCEMAVNAHAQSSRQPGFTAGSKVAAKPNGLYDIGAEALIGDTHTNGLGSFNLPFTLPSNSTILRFQGSFSWAANCHGDVLFALFVDGTRYDSIILKTGGTSQNIWFDYTMPIATGSGTAALHIEGNPTCPGDYAGMSSAEIQAMIQVQ